MLKDDTTLEENKVSENGFMVVMVTKVSKQDTTPQCTQCNILMCMFNAAEIQGT